MLRKHASLIIAMSLIALVATACIVRTRRPPPPGQRVYVEKHKDQKHKEPKPDKPDKPEKHKKHKD